MKDDAAATPGVGGNRAKAAKTDHFCPHCAGLDEVPSSPAETTVVALKTQNY